MLNQCKVVFSNLKNKTPPQIKKPFIQTWIFFLKRARSAFLFNQKIRGKIIFIHIQKCGGTSIENALGIPFKFHDTAAGRRHRLGNKAWGRAFSFALVRHPYSRIVSLYNYRHSRSINFADQFSLNDWVVEVFHKKTPDIIGDRNAMASCVYHISDSRKKIIVDKWIKLEDIDQVWPFLREELLAFQGTASKLPMKIPKENVSYNDPKTVSDLTENSKCMIYNALRDDFKYFGYKK